MVSNFRPNPDLALECGAYYLGGASTTTSVGSGILPTWPFPKLDYTELAEQVLCYMLWPPPLLKMPISVKRMSNKFVSVYILVLWSFLKDVVVLYCVDDIYIYIYIYIYICI